MPTDVMMFVTSNFDTDVTSTPNVNFENEFGWNVNFGTMSNDYVMKIFKFCAEVRVPKFV